MPALVASDLVARFGSPLYVYDVEAVRVAYRAFEAAFPYAPSDCHYAIVCNKNPHLVRALRDLGAGIHANTPGDAFAALAAGVPADRVVYSGTNLDAADLDFLLARGIRANLDSLDQLRDWLAARSRHPGSPAGVGLRLAVDDPRIANRIGIAPEDVPAAVALAASAGARIEGLHMYAGTNTRKLDRFVSCFDAMVQASEHLPDLAYLDLGGGYGVAYREGHVPLDLQALGAAIAQRMTALSTHRGRPIRLLLEPGRLVVAQAGRLLTRVVSVKERGGRRFVGVDATVGNIVVESVYHPYHRVAAVSPRGAALDTPTDVCGNTTHTRDFLGRDLRLPELLPGDLLALHDVGAYGYAMSSHFLNRPRPAEVVIDNHIATLSTRREGFADLVATWAEPVGAML